MDKDISEIKKMISVGNKFQVVEIVETDNGYLVQFKLENGTKINLTTSKRNDRDWNARVHKSLDTAIRVIKSTNYSGFVLVRV